MFSNLASCDPTTGYVSLKNAGSPFFRLDIAAASFSTVALLIMAILKLSDEKTRAHPNQMIAYVFLCDAYMFF